MKTLKDYKEAIKIGASVIATVEYFGRNTRVVTRIGTVKRVQAKQYFLKYGQLWNDQFVLRFPLVREVEMIEGNKIRYSTYVGGEKISTSTIEVGK